MVDIQTFPLIDKTYNIAIKEMSENKMMHKTWNPNAIHSSS